MPDSAILRWLLSSSALIAAAAAITPPVQSDDWPTLGRDRTRNAVSQEQHAPTDWDVNTGRNIRWKAEVGAIAFGTHVLADGRVWIGGNRQKQRPLPSGGAALLNCFDERTGALLYEYESPRLAPDPGFNDPDFHSLSSSPLIEGDRLWFVTNRAETVCLNIAPLSTQPPGKPEVVWKVDLRERFGVQPKPPLMGPGYACSIAPSYEGLIFVTTSNGVDLNHKKIAAPEAPGLVCFRRDTGEVKWQKPTGEFVLHGEIASPLVADIGGRGQVVVPHGDGWLRAYDPPTGELLWTFDCNPKTAWYSARGKSDRNYFLAPPVLYEDRIYIASGHQMEMGDGPGRLVCVDPTRRGDISSELGVDADGKPLPQRRYQAVDPNAGERAVPNPNSGLVWEFTRVGKEYRDVMHATTCSVVVHNGLLVAADIGGVIHCFDARTGRRHWSYDPLTAVLASPLIADGKVYVVTEDGTVLIFGLSSDPAVAMKLAPNVEPAPIAQFDMGQPIYVAPIFSNGTLYVTPRDTLYAIGPAGQVK